MQFIEGTPADLAALIAYHNERSAYVVLDTETTGLDYFSDAITAVILSGYEIDQAYLFLPAALPLLKSLSRPVVAHNFKFDFHMLLRAGVDLRASGLCADTLLLDHLLDENAEHGLDAIIQRRYQDPYKEAFWGQYDRFDSAPKEAQLEYACKDVIYTGKVYRDITTELNLSGIPASLVEHVHRLALALYDTEVRGLRLDLAYLEQLAVTLSEKIRTLKLEMRSQADLACLIVETQEYRALLDSKKQLKTKLKVTPPTFNFDSNQQLGRLLYDRLKLPIRYGKKRQRTVDDAALESLEGKHPVVSKIREYRGYQKVFTAFIEGSREKMHAGRIHPSFNVNGTVTGRISSSQPNMQQLPKEGGVRGIYAADPGHVLISCDYQQLEVTLAAHFSQDQNLLKIVHEGASQHDITAQGLGVPRPTAKQINFAMQYGAGARKIQEIIGCSADAAQDALDKYWETYAGLRAFIKECHARVESGLPLAFNPFRRLRRFPPVESMGIREIERAKRQAANAVIQGTGADITNRAYYLTADLLKRKVLGRALFPIHDEILIEVPEGNADQAADVLKAIMCQVPREIPLSVPLNVDCSKPMKRWAKG